MKNIAVIGAGASGLMIARKLSEDCHLNVFLFEKGKNVGTKLRASGGGKANISNRHIQPENYNQPKFIAQLLAKFGPQQLEDTFAQLGMPTVSDDEGRVYPCTEFSQTVVNVLWRPDRPNVHTELEYEVKTISRHNGHWRVNDYPILFDQMVIATGTPANMIAKNRVGYNDFLKDLHVRQHDFVPSLVGFKINNHPKSLSGCRTKVNAALYQRNNLIHTEAGEVTFKDDGISGIVILNLSAYYHRLECKEKCAIHLDFLPQHPDYNWQKHLQEFHSLQGILHPKLNALFEQHPFDVRNYKMEVAGTYEIDFAQVCHGGIDLAEIDENFQLINHPNLFVTGELLDVDGVCGGYNLFFAFASAMVVAEQILQA